MIPQFETIYDFMHAQATLDFTTDAFWTCECRINYLHPKTRTKCPICNYEHHESPDTCVFDVIDILLPQCRDIDTINQLILVLLKYNERSEK